MANKKPDTYIYDGPFGKLVYETEDGAGVVQLDGDGVYTAKIYIPHNKPWDAAATQLLADCREIRNWGQNLAGFKKKVAGRTVFKADENYESTKYAENDKTCIPENDERTYNLFHAWTNTEMGWRLFTNDNEFMFIFRSKSKVQDFYDDFFDSSWYPVRYLRRWFSIVNGLE